MENTLYWIMEYGKVLLGYGFLMFIWPLTVFRGFLKGRGATFKFSFCVTAQVVIINTVVLLLGLLHILNDWTMRILFYGVFIYSIREWFKITPERKNKFKYLVNGSYGFKNFVRLEVRKYTRKLEELLKPVWLQYRRNWQEYTLLVLIVAYGMLYFSWGAFQNNSYGFGDMYVHHAWTYGLTQGKIFSAGVYPEAMHCVIYSIHTLLGVKLFSCYLFMAGIHIAIILVAAYCFLKEIFRWRFCAIFVLAVFLVLDVSCVDEVFSMSRLQWTLPQEYGFHTMYLCALYLMKYLLSEKLTKLRKREINQCWDENLLLFILSLAASIAIHFYVTIMAFFLCAAVVLCLWRKVFTKKHFIPLVAGVMMGVMVAAAPMLGALASGIPFQGSIGWAMNVINGTDTGAGRTHAIQSGNKTEKSEGTQNQTESSLPENQMPNMDESGVLTHDSEESKSFPSIMQKLWETLKKTAIKIFSFLKEKVQGVYKYGYEMLYTRTRAKWIVGATCLVAVICVLYNLYYAYRDIRDYSADNRKEEYVLGYPIILMATVFYMIIYAGPYINLPELIAGSRLCSTEHLLLITVFIILLDMIYTALEKCLDARFMKHTVGVVTAALVVLIYTTGNYHGYLYYELTRYNAAVSVTNEVIETLPENTYTIVSTTDEIYQVIQDGRHEELHTFIKNQNKESYTLPTEYIFFFVEKQPLRYAHSHFFSGPECLAKNKYERFYTGYSISVGENIDHSEISPEAAKQTVGYLSKPAQAYSVLANRTILESKMYEWCAEFEEAYPNEMKIYYEDEAFVCYYVQQNVQRLYNLGLN